MEKTYFIAFYEIYGDKFVLTKANYSFKTIDYRFSNYQIIALIVTVLKHI